MKRRNHILQLTAVCALALLLLGGCTGSITGYSGKEATQGGVSYCINDRGSKAFATVCTWDMDPDHAEFDIVGEIEGAPVISLGGFTGTGVPNPFVIEADPDLKAIITSDPAIGNWEVPVTWQDLQFTIYIGKNVTKINGTRDSLYYGVETGEGIAFYRPVCYFVCDDANPTLYSKDGVLYLRSDDTKLEVQDRLLERKEPGSASPAGG
jgi:hypothetical protein